MSQAGIGKIMGSLQKNKTTGIVIFAVVIVGLIAYSNLKFNDYVDSNAKGICWSEGRKLTPEELHIRVLKMMVLKEQKEFEQDPKISNMEYYWRRWRMVKADAGPETLHQLLLQHSSINTGFQIAGVLHDVNKEKLGDDAFYKELVEKNTC
jgi:hypothetical protein